MSTRIQSIRKKDKYGHNFGARWNGYEELSGTLWNQIRGNAKKQNKGFDLTKEYLWELFLQQNRKCSLSGEELSLTYTFRKGQKIKPTASLDRIDSSKGYIQGNVQWIHKELQPIKSNRTEERLLYWARKLVEYAEKKS